MFGQNTFPASGSVGIGTTSPAEKLGVNGFVLFEGSYQTGGVRGKDFAGNEGTVLAVWHGTAADYVMVGDISDQFSRVGVYAGGGEAISVRPNGNVGIGTTNPQHPLQVNGAIGATEVIVSSRGARLRVRARLSTGSLGRGCRLHKSQSPSAGDSFGEGSGRKGRQSRRNAVEAAGENRRIDAPHDPGGAGESGTANEGSSIGSVAGRSEIDAEPGRVP